jgi:hypothetical protein
MTFFKKYHHRFLKKSQIIPQNLGIFAQKVVHLGKN